MYTSKKTAAPHKSAMMYFKAKRRPFPDGVDLSRRFMLRLYSIENTFAVSSVRAAAHKINLLAIPLLSVRLMTKYLLTLYVAVTSAAVIFVELCLM